ncbi:MAG: type II toxin-antitoxin system HicA family toxin [Syntrophomonas sp.]|uniref:type II toxin-antitoxin system HicA family toxin n=1 Tax=Syntrophomonas sp. TaxID=2053627 RepID=UPI00260592CF|nr:type II toxin-antitoxin system HicA family toxin [Syntrophomonas sp.]MDD4627397.1 type II toxin-antitoxin system HicA family toxin [Syntrophomonas sp.]
MSQFEKVLLNILSGLSDQNISFPDLCKLLTSLGSRERVRGSHHIFFKKGVEEIINIQAKGSEAKAYQVKQIREIIIKYKLGGKRGV